MLWDKHLAMINRLPWSEAPPTEDGEVWLLMPGSLPLLVVARTVDGQRYFGSVPLHLALVTGCKFACPLPRQETR